MPNIYIIGVAVAVLLASLGGAYFVGHSNGYNAAELKVAAANAKARKKRDAKIKADQKTIKALTAKLATQTTDALRATQERDKALRDFKRLTDANSDPSALCRPSDRLRDDFNAFLRRTASGAPALPTSKPAHIGGLPVSLARPQRRRDMEKLER